MVKLELRGSNSFATGACYYQDYPPNEPQNRRLVIPLRLAEENIITYAVVDTGAPWSVLDPGRTKTLTGYSIDDTDVRLQIRGTRFKGDLWRIPVEMVAHEGNSFTFEATVFVPKFRIETETWSLPEFVGLQGFLDRIRFAVDPEENLFYFGALGEA